MRTALAANSGGTTIPFVLIQAREFLIGEKKRARRETGRPLQKCMVLIERRQARYIQTEMDIVAAREPASHRRGLVRQRVKRRPEAGFGTPEQGVGEVLSGTRSNDR